MWGTKGAGLRTTLENWVTLRTRTHQRDAQFRDTRVEVRVLGQGPAFLLMDLRDSLFETIQSCVSCNSTSNMSSTLSHLMPLFHWLDLASPEQLRTAQHVVCCISIDPLLLR
ncbi:hypothetical protein ATANTOWER_030783 [Ataeniobius toweri]|uniref:Uncharacterized protein n=1 Tax=Ataeniobius toweri TaxID=208326 RepID=A0ABU7BIT5_9TELE|nr:hypothetical protein [Ataeniobius toweri]